MRRCTARARCMQIEPQREECYYEDAKTGDMMEANIMLFRGGKLDIKMRIEDPAGRILHEQLLMSNIDDATVGSRSYILLHATCSARMYRHA